MTERVLAKLTTKNGQAYVYGGFLRDAICLGNNHRSGDIDVAMSMADYMALKDPADDIRKAFVLHEPHLLFMAHQIMDDTFTANSRPLVLRLKAEVQAAWGLSHPVGLTLYRTEVPVDALLNDNDLGLNCIVYDGQQLRFTPAFERDVKNRSMTMLKATDLRDYMRTLRRWKDFKNSGYAEWNLVIPECLHAQYAAEAAATLAANPAT